MSRASRIGLALFFVANAVFFLRALQTPIHWQQGEISYYNLLWSARHDDGRDLTLAGGLHTSDFKKLIHSELLDEEFRPRHFSYLTSMLALKLDQVLPGVTFLDRTQVFFHLINVLLLMALIYAVTKNPVAAGAGGMLFLNAGIAVNTLLFPFRNAKILTVLLFLAAWLCLAGGTTSPSRNWSRRFTGFFILLFLAVFTDETALFLFPVAIGHVFYSRILPREERGRFLRGLIATGLLFLTCLLVLISLDALHGGASLSGSRREWEVLLHYAHPQAVRDVLQAFISNLLAANMGGWGPSVAGRTALAVSVLLLTLSVWRRPPVASLVMAGIAVAAVFLKGFALPYFWGYDKIMMPSPETYPTLLWFNYYYTYPDTLLLCLALALLASKMLSARSYAVAGLTLITLLGFLNLMNAGERLRKPLLVHGDYQTSRPVIPKLLRLEEILRKTSGTGALYASFPSGSQALFFRERAGNSIWQSDPLGEAQHLLPSSIPYATLLPVKFLPALERGDLIMSLHNVPQAVSNDGELARARFFYDVERERLLDLQTLRPLNAAPLLTSPSKVPAQGAVFTFPISPDGPPGQELVLFVKNAARIRLDEGGAILEAVQRYGYSYQMFRFPYPEHGGEVHLRLAPVSAQGESPVFCGPFLLRVP